MSNKINAFLKEYNKTTPKITMKEFSDFIDSLYPGVDIKDGREYTIRVVFTRNKQELSIYSNELNERE